MSGLIHVVMGGQFGSEGKGEFTAYLASQLASEGKLGGVVRVGGPNAGHTMTLYHPSDDLPEDGIPKPRSHKIRQIPCAWHLDGVPLFLGPGAVIDAEVLHKEMANVVSPIIVDNQAIAIDGDEEFEKELVERIGSTGKGIGSARARHVWRTAKTFSYLQFSKAWNQDLFEGVVFDDVPVLLAGILDSGKDIIVESTQGFLLSLALSGYYPYVTSRDVTPGIILNDAGLSSTRPHRVYAVCRMFPIRVSGNSGHLPGEVTWDHMSELAGREIEPERTTVTNNVRRIGVIDQADSKRMATVCQPNSIVLTFLDYTSSCASTHNLNAAAMTTTERHDAMTFIRRVQARYFNDIPILHFSTGPGVISPVYQLQQAPRADTP